MASELRTAVREGVIARGILASRVDELLDDAPEPWWLSADDNALVADVSLLAPPLGAAEVRLRIGAPPEGSQAWELSIVAHDRPGLLGLTADVVAQHELSIVHARIASWAHEQTALQRVSVVPVKVPLSGEPEWTFIGQALRTALTGPPAEPTYPPVLPDGCAVRSVKPGRLETHWLIDIEARDEVGLLARIAGTLLALGADVIAADIRSVNGRATDTFLVQLDDAAGLRTVQALAAQSMLADEARRMTMAG